MFTTPTRHRGVAALATLSLVFTAACGSSDDGGSVDDGVASLSDQDDPAVTEGTQGAESATSDKKDRAGTEQVEAPDNPEDAFALFEDCMADAGLDMQPVDDDDGPVQVLGDDDGAVGGITIGGAADDFDPEQFEQIASRCEAHLANLDASFEMSPEQEAAFEDAQLEWTDCMREQGVEVPEFDSGSGTMVVIGGPDDTTDPQADGSFDDADFDFEAFEAADQACNHVFEEFENLDGEVDQ